MEGCALAATFVKRHRLRTGLVEISVTTSVIMEAP
jgi:hypothetical protein